MHAPVRLILDHMRSHFNGRRLCVAEGYLLEFERRGYLQAGCYVPEVVIEHPDLVEALHREFVHAGSDVVLALTYYAHREKMRIINRSDDLEAINRTALKIARKVADETKTLMAGNICNTSLYNPSEPKVIEDVKAIFKEQVTWAVDEGADFIVGETFNEYGEALLALEAIKQYGKGKPAVISLACNTEEATFDGVPVDEACRKIEEAGAAVVGLNCSRGPETLLPVIQQVRKVCKGPICCLPVVFRTTSTNKTMQSLRSPITGERAYPFDLPAFQCTRTEIAEFTKRALKIGIQYLGLCCGNSAHYTRVMAEEMGRTPPGSRFSPDMTKNIYYGSDPTLPARGLGSAKLIG